MFLIVLYIYIGIEALERYRTWRRDIERQNFPSSWTQNRLGDEFCH